MKKITVSICILLIILLSSCTPIDDFIAKTFLDYAGKDRDLYTAAVANVFGAYGNISNGEVCYSPVMTVIETDDYGRKLYFYSEYDYSPEGKIIVVLGLDQKMNVPRGSRAELASDLLGNIKINLILGDNPTDLLSVGDTIVGGLETGIMSKVGEMLPAVEAILPKLDSIMTSLNQLLADPALRNTLHNVEGMTGHLNATSQQLQALSTSLNRDVPSMMKRADGLLENTQQLTANLSDIDVAGMTARVNQTLANVEQMTQKLNSNEGTLGLLMRDATLYNNLSSTAASADSLLIDFKEHPKRYIHFSVFGKKDK